MRSSTEKAEVLRKAALYASDDVVREAFEEAAEYFERRGGERFYGDGAREAPSGRYGCVMGGMVSMPITGPWVHFEDWLANELELERITETIGKPASGAERRPEEGLEVEDEFAVFWKEVCVFITLAVLVIAVCATVIKLAA